MAGKPGKSGRKGPPLFDGGPRSRSEVPAYVREFLVDQCGDDLRLPRDFARMPAVLKANSEHPNITRGQSEISKINSGKSATRQIAIEHIATTYRDLISKHSNSGAAKLIANKADPKIRVGTRTLEREYIPQAKTMLSRREVKK